MEEGIGVAPLIGFDWNLLMIAITLVVLFFILKKFFFKKVHQFMQNRENEIQGSYDKIDRLNKDAEDNKTKYEKKIVEIETERIEVLRKAKIEAEKRTEEIIETANKKAEDIVKKAEQRATQEKEAAQAEIRNQIAVLSIAVAEKVLKNNLTEEQKTKFNEGIEL